MFLWSDHHGGLLTPWGARSQLTHPGLGSFEERYQVACFSQVLVWSERSGGAPASASVLMTATDGPQARLTIERHPALGSAGQHVSVDVSVLGTLLSFSVHSFLIGWLLEYSVMLV